MRVVEKGEGKPEYGVLACMHGDEPSGKKAIEKLFESEYEFQKPVKFVIANEEALEENERFLDADLNRSFPGDPESSKHEERLAARFLDELKGMSVIDLHSTRSKPVPFMTFGEMNSKILKMMKNTGVDKACYFEESSGVLGEYLDAFIVESGPQRTEEATEMAFEILKNYLVAEEIIQADFEISNPEIFKYYETVEGGGWEFLAKNFSKVEKGEVFAKSGTTELISTEDFYPVLMSTDGYEDVLGQKAKKLGKATELMENH